MKKRELDEVETKLSILGDMADELHALLLDEHPAIAEKYRKIGHYARKHRTCIRVHGQLPLERPTPLLVQAAKGIHVLSKRLPKG